MLVSGGEPDPLSPKAAVPSEHAPAFNVEPPTPTAAVSHPQQAEQQSLFVDPKEAVASLPLKSSQLQDPLQPPERGTSPSGFSSSSSIRASPLAYSRHHPYARSVSPYEEFSAAESYGSGPARSRRTHSHVSRSSYSSVDGDYTPEDDPPYEDEPDVYIEPIRPNGRRTSSAAKSPVRLTATGKPSHARRLPPGHIKRPRNAFILFRSHACVNNLVPASLNITDHRHISRIVGQMWKNLAPEERRIWEIQAEREKEEHRRAYPDYKYRPVYRREGVVRRRRRKTVDNKDIEEEERKCEVVARVLLEGGDISENRVERELEIQRERDEIEGRVRGPAAKSPARGAQARRLLPVQPHFDMNYGMIQYGQQVEDAHYDTRRVDSAAMEDMGARYGVDGHIDEVDGDQEVGYHYHQRSHTLPPSLNYEQGYYGADGHQAAEEVRTGRAPPPQPLSLYRNGDASLVPPISPGILFGTGADFQSQAYPSTPRTLAMLQQHNIALQQRLKGNNGTLLSPRAADFGLNPRVRPNGSSETMLVSPTRPFHQDSLSLGFEHGFLDGAIAGEADVPGDQQQQKDRRTSVDMTHQQRSFSADDAAQHPGWQPQHSSRETEDKGQLAFATDPTGMDDHNHQQKISFQPDADVTYVFLDAKQAQDQALIDSIRAQGFGITLDASQEEIAALSATTLAAR